LPRGSGLKKGLNIKGLVSLALHKIFSAGIVGLLRWVHFTG